MDSVNKFVMSRKQLYDEVWQQSVSGVAKKYNLHYGKLINSLKEAKIPYPPSGYWTRLACGKDVSQEVVVLSEPTEEMVYLLPADYSSMKEYKKSKRAEVKTKQEGNAEGIEEDIEENAEIEVPDTVLPFLPKEERESVTNAMQSIGIVKNARLHKMVASYKQSIKEWEDRQRNSRHDGYYQRRSSSEPPLFVNDVSKEGLNRIIAILDALFKAVEKLGGEIQPNLSMKIRNDIVRVEFAEGKDKAVHELTKQEAKELFEYKEKVKRGGYAYKPSIRKYDYSYNGKLRIVFGERNYIRDSVQETLEEKLDETLIRLYETSEKYRIIREKREEQERIRREKELIEIQKLERLEKEQNDTQRLVNEASDYRIACEIRGYIEALSRSEKLEEKDKEWIDWASKKADWYDPVIALEDELLGKREHSLSKEEKVFKPPRRSTYYGW